MIKKFEEYSKINENGNNDTPQEIMANMKTIANWHTYQDNPNTNRVRGIIVPGKFIEVGDVKGYINRIEKNIVYIDVLSDTHLSEDKHIKQIPLSTVIKAYKIKKEKDVKKEDTSISGPSGTNVGTTPKEESGNVGAKIDSKSKDVENNLYNKIYTLKDFGKLNNKDLTPEFDSTTLKPNKNEISPDINKTSDAAKDQKITDKNYIVKKIGDMTNLAQEIDDKKIKTKDKSIESSIDGKADTKAETDISNKIFKVKKLEL